MRKKALLRHRSIVAPDIRETQWIFTNSWVSRALIGILYKAEFFTSFPLLAIGGFQNSRPQYHCFNSWYTSENSCYEPPTLLSKTHYWAILLQMKQQPESENCYKLEWVTRKIVLMLSLNTKILFLIYLD